MSSPLVTALSFSGGTGSGCLLEMILRGDLVAGGPLVVTSADPGMENSETYEYVNRMESRCRVAGIPFLRVRRNLLADLLALKASGRTRMDLPPFWTRDRETGKKGRLLQRCTKYYKIAPMDKALRVWMDHNLGISRKNCRLPVRCVRKWIGFSADEWSRISEPRQKYAFFEYPLIDRKMTKADIAAYFARIGEKLPPRSVCNACYANDLAHLKKMHDERPDEFWNQAVPVDEAIRDLRCVGVHDECFVSSTLIPLRELAARGFKLGPREAEQDAERCNSGHCFI